VLPTNESARPALPDRAPRLWTLWAAARPSQVLLVALVYALGLGIATNGPPFAGDEWQGLGVELPSLLAGLLAVVAVTVPIHYANEYADAETDRLTERTPFSGGSGALARTGLPRRFLRRATAAATVGSVLAISGLVTTGNHTPAALLTVILGLGLAYSLPPVALIRRGVGELVNAVLGGLLLPLYGVSVVAIPRPAVAAVVLPFALLVGCNLCATHWPDRDADARVGKRTLAVRLVPEKLRRLYATLAVAAGLIIVTLWAIDLLPTPLVLAHLPAVPLLLWGWRTLARQRSPFPAVAAMVVVAVTTTVAWWWLGVG